MTMEITHPVKVRQLSGSLPNLSAVYLYTAGWVLDIKFGMRFQYKTLRTIFLESNLKPEISQSFHDPWIKAIFLFDLP